MTQETIEGNKSIALFMGGTLAPIAVFMSIVGEGWHFPKELDKIYASGLHLPFYDHALQFNSDWNWLMTAVKKIEWDFGKMVKIEGFSCEITSASNENPSKKPFRIFKHCNTKEQAVFEAVVEFVNYWKNNPDYHD